MFRRFVHRGSFPDIHSNVSGAARHSEKKAIWHRSPLQSPREELSGIAAALHPMARLNIRSFVPRCVASVTSMLRGFAIGLVASRRR